MAVASVAELNEACEVVVIFPISVSSLIHPDDVNIVYLKQDGRNNLSSDSAVCPLHVRSIAKGRLKNHIGRLSEEQLDTAMSILMDALGIAW